MSSLIVEAVKIESVTKHPNADRLDLIGIKGWQCVARKGDYVVNELAIYLPVDAILPEALELLIFGPDTKVKLIGHRVRTIKLRGVISQGLLVKPSELGLPANIKVGTDVTKLLGITKYEPPVSISHKSNAQSVSSKQTNPNFRKYTDIENYKNYPNMFVEGEPVQCSSKLHGTSFRCGYNKFHAFTMWDRFKQWLHLAPEYQFTYGSRQVQLQSKLLYKGYYDTNVYAEAVVKYHLRTMIPKGYCVYGEIIGRNIQKGYTYGCKPGERRLVVYDVMCNGVYLDWRDAKVFCTERNLEYVPVLYTGGFNADLIKPLVDGPSVYAPSQLVREGIVIRPEHEACNQFGRKILKWKSAEFDLAVEAKDDGVTIAH